MVAALRQTAVSTIISPTELDIASLEIAAANGDPIALNDLGALFYEGKAVPKNYALARDYFERAVEKDNTLAYFNLSIFHMDGLGGLKESFPRALQLAKVAADRGLEIARFNVGLFYLGGEGVEANPALVLHYLGDAAKQDDPEASLRVGSILYTGAKGIPADIEEALRLLKTADNHGSAEAAHNLGVHYFSRAQNENENSLYSVAARYFAKAAKKMWLPSIHNLAHMFQGGMGVSKDYDKCDVLYKASAIHGFDLSIECLKKLEVDFSKGYNEDLFREILDEVARPTAPELVSNGDQPPPEPVVETYKRAKSRTDPTKSSGAVANRHVRIKKVRISPQQLERIDKTCGGNRSQWFVKQFESYLSQVGGQKPEDFADFQATKPINISMSYDLEKRIQEAARLAEIKPTKWMLRVAQWGLEQKPPTLDNQPSLH